MTGQHLDPRAIAGDADNDGHVLTTQGGVPGWAAPATPPTPPVPLTTIGPDGPGILFAADGHIIYAEAP